jgi:hypothetical protein
LEIIVAYQIQKNARYSEIVETLTKLVDSKQSGMMFVHSECNHAITIALDNGQIHAIYFGANRGRKAISLINRISGGSYRFETTDYIETSHYLPPTPEILNLLRNPYVGHESKSSFYPPITTKELVIENQKNILSQNLKTLFTKHMGPIAEMLFDDIVDELGDFSATPQQTHVLINKLSEEIEITDQAEHFRIKAYEILNDI